MSPKNIKLSTIKKILFIIGFGIIAVIVIGYFIFHLLSFVYSERVIVVNDTENTIEIGVITYCYECNPPKYQIIHGSKKISPDEHKSFNIWWDDEHFETPIFYRVSSNNSKEYYCGLDNKSVYKWSDVNKIDTLLTDTNILQEVGDICANKNINGASNNKSDVGTVQEPDIQDNVTEQEDDQYPKYEDVKPTYSEDEVCTAGPWQTDIGRLIFPVSEKYKYSFLGELYTAIDCGGERVEQIFGVEGKFYTLGANMQLHHSPSKEFKDVLEQIGFICADRNDVECTHWRLEDSSVSIEDIIKLKPFSNEIQSVDCIHCG